LVWEVRPAGCGHEATVARVASNGSRSAVAAIDNLDRLRLLLISHWTLAERNSVTGSLLTPRPTESDLFLPLTTDNRG